MCRTASTREFAVETPHGVYPNNWNASRPETLQMEFGITPGVTEHGCDSEPGTNEAAECIIA